MEGVFEEVRRVVEGRRWGRIEAKQAAVKAILERLQVEERSRRLVGWSYIQVLCKLYPND